MQRSQFVRTSLTTNIPFTSLCPPVKKKHIFLSPKSIKPAKFKVCNSRCFLIILIPMKMKNPRVIHLLVLLLSVLLASQLGHGRLISDDGDTMISDEPDSNRPFLEWGLSAATETCEPTYGFLPCSTNVWGLLFMIVVYEILLSLGGQYVGMGSNLFFQMIGPGIFGASLFQLLGTIPQIVLVLVSSLSGPLEAAQQRASLGMGLVAGSTVMLLTLTWGICVVLGSYDLSETSPSDDDNKSSSQITFSKSNYGVITDAETSYTARLMLVTLVPFLILLLTKIFKHSEGRRVIILLALIVTLVLLVAYVFYQIFQPWVQNRRFEYLMNKYAKDKLLRLLSRNGKPDTRKIQQLFDKVDKNKNTSVSALELRVLLLGLDLNDDDLSTERDVENILESFDVSGDGLITRDEFIKGMTKLVTDLSDQTPDRIKRVGGGNAQNLLQQGLLANSSRSSRRGTTSSWLNYVKAFFYVILGTVLLCALSEPLINSVVGFSQAANLSSFAVSYLAIPFAMNYGALVGSIASSQQKSQKSISLTLSSLYGGVYMNNIIGLIVFLAPVFARHLWADVFKEILVVLIICIGMTVLASMRTTFTRVTGYLVLSLYPISLVLIYLFTAVF